MSVDDVCQRMLEVARQFWQKGLMMLTFTRNDIGDRADWPIWRKRRLTSAKRIIGAFRVVTREGELTCPDGYLAVDSQGWPYPIAKDEFEEIYERAS